MTTAEASSPFWWALHHAACSTRAQRIMLYSRIEDSTSFAGPFITPPAISGYSVSYCTVHITPQQKSCCHFSGLCTRPPVVSGQDGLQQVSSWLWQLTSQACASAASNTPYQRLEHGFLPCPLQLLPRCPCIVVTLSSICGKATDWATAAQ